MSKNDRKADYSTTTVTKTEPEVESFDENYLEEGEDGNLVEVKVKKEVTKVTMMKVQSSSSMAPGSIAFNTKEEAEAYANALADPDADLSQFLPKDSPETGLQIEEVVEEKVQPNLKVTPTAPKEAFALDVDSDVLDTNHSSPYESDSPDKQFISPEPKQKVQENEAPTNVIDEKMDSGLGSKVEKVKPKVVEETVNNLLEPNESENKKFVAEKVNKVGLDAPQENLEEKIISVKENVEEITKKTEEIKLEEVSAPSLGLTGISQEPIQQNLESLNIAATLPMDSPDLVSEELDYGTVLGVDIDDLYCEEELDSAGISLDSNGKVEPMINIDLRNAETISSSEQPSLPPKEAELPPPLPPKDYWNKSNTASPSPLHRPAVGAHPLSRDTTAQSSPTPSTNRMPTHSSSDPSLKRGKDLPITSMHNLKPDTNDKDKGDTDKKETKGFMLKNLGAHDWTAIDFLADKNCGFFQDAHQRHLITRGINVGANTKNPVTPDSAYGQPNFYNHRDISFVGRPFPLEEASTHFARLKAWGLTFIRFLVPWEALEHFGPKEYDMEYISYLRQVFAVASEYGLKVVLDPHQDTWSRFSGGSGAPGWTFEVAGMDLTKFDVTGAAHLQGMDLIHPSHIPLWSTNYTKLATSTMFTLFFGGNHFAPGRLYDGIPVQDFLQNHYIECYQHLAECLRGCSAVVGFEIMNEPHSGYIGNEILTNFDEDVDLHLGLMPTPLQSMALGEGYATKVAYYNKSWPWPSRASGFVELNKNGSRAWLEGVRCVWQEQGIWEIDYRTGQPKLLKPHYFAAYEDGKKIDFDQEFYLPFIKRMTYSLRVINPDLILFLAPVPNHAPPKVGEGELTHFAYAPHWYDLKSIFNKAFDGRITHDVLALAKGSRNFFAHTYFGINGARKCYSKQVKTVLEWGKPPHIYLDAPVFIGELGIPMDINAQLAYTNGDYTLHNTFMDAVLNAVDANFASVALWTYNPINTHRDGDSWNFEDFSVLSLDQPVETDRTKELDNPLHRFGRCLNAVVRPYASKVAGRPVHMSFDLTTLEFHLEFRAPPPPSTQELRKMTPEQKRLRRQTEIFLPSYHYKRRQILVDVSDGNYRYVPELSTLYYWYGDDRKVEPVLPTTDFEDDGMELSDDETENPQNAFQFNQLDDEDELAELDVELVSTTTLHKVRVLLQDFVNDDW